MARGKADPQRHDLKRKGDPYLDRRCGEDRRRVYSLDYFLQGRPDRRHGSERRSLGERRHDCIRINRWSSVCPDKNELIEDKPYIIRLRKTPPDNQ